MFFNFFAEESFHGPHESFIQGLHFVAAVRWEANDVSMILPSCTFIACEYLPSGTKITGSYYYYYFFFWFCMLDEMKKQLGENLALYPPREIARVD